MGLPGRIWTNNGPAGIARGDGARNGTPARPQPPNSVPWGSSFTSRNLQDLGNSTDGGIACSLDGTPSIRFAKEIWFFEPSFPAAFGPSATWEPAEAQETRTPFRMLGTQEAAKLWKPTLSEMGISRDTMASTQGVARRAGERSYFCCPTACSGREAAQDTPGPRRLQHVAGQGNPMKEAGFINMLGAGAPEMPQERGGCNRPPGKGLLIGSRVHHSVFLIGLHVRGPSLFAPRPYILKACGALVVEEAPVHAQASWREVALVAVPGALLGLYDALSFVTASRVDPVTYQVLLKSRVILTGLLWQLVFLQPMVCFGHLHGGGVIHVLVRSWRSVKASILTGEPRHGHRGVCFEHV